MQNPRVRLALMAVSTLALLAIAGFVIFADPGSGDTKPAVTDGFAGAIRPQAPATDFALTDQDGRSVAVVCGGVSRTPGSRYEIDGCDHYPAQRGWRTAPAGALTRTQLPAPVAINAPQCDGYVRGKTAGASRLATGMP